jgi:TIR domain
VAASYDLLTIKNFMLKRVRDPQSLCFRLKQTLGDQYEYRRIRGEGLQQTLDNILDTADVNEQVGELVMEAAAHWIDDLNGNPLILARDSMVEGLVVAHAEMKARGETEKTQRIQELIRKVDPGHIIDPPTEGKASPSGTPDVFLSYCHQDRVIMECVYQALTAAGLAVWVDREGIQPGTKSWTKAIETAIDHAQVVVVLFSPDARQSEWVDEELGYARRISKAIYPILTRGSEVESIPFGFTLTQWVDVRNKADCAPDVQHLAAIIKQQIGKS